VHYACYIFWGIRGYEVLKVSKRQKSDMLISCTGPAIYIARARATVFSALQFFNDWSHLSAYTKNNLAKMPLINETKNCFNDMNRKMCIDLWASDDAFGQAFCSL
jgi:hypothetical protein